MKNYLFLGIILLFCALQPALAEEPQAATEAIQVPVAEDLQPPAETAKPVTAPVLGWGLLWSGSWEETETFHNREEFRLSYPALGLLLRGESLERRTINFSADPIWGDGSKDVSNFSGGLYHQPTGSRLLYGILDEWGLSARIRSPWIRSAPFAENHKPLIADMKTAVSVTKEPEAYLYLSSPWLAVLPEMKLRGFALAQTKVDGLRAQQQRGEANTLPTQPQSDEFKPDFGGGLEVQFSSMAKPAPVPTTGTSKPIVSKTSILLEGFYTGAELPARKPTSWFADPPPLPEREFELYGMGLLINAPYWALSSDIARSETFAVGRDFYSNVGLRLTPPLNSEKKPGPWSLSLAADSAGEHFTGRDGSIPHAGFRTADKVEWKGARSSLFRITSTLRGPGFGDDFNRSSSGIYYRFPSPVKGKNAKVDVFPLRLTRLSFGADRNATNPKKILDSIDGTVGLSLNLLPLHIKSPLGINLSGSLKNLCPPETNPQPWPNPLDDHDFNSVKTSAELTWSPGLFQFRTKWGYTETAKKDGLWDTSFSVAIHPKVGRFSVKVATLDFPNDWKYTFSWRLEKK